MQIADLQTLAAMDNDETIKTMVKAERPKYIRYDTAVALLDEELMPDS
jgi:formate-dependent phosphoribosylglycinamide formyltransferase (GAR transformylase)